MQILNGNDSKSINLEKIINKNEVIFIVGPTASGKTALANQISEKIKENGSEIFVFDSRQIFKFFNIGTGKDLSSYFIKPKLVDICEPNEIFTAFDFQKKAKEEFEKSIKNHKKIIITIGTGLYFDSFLWSFEFAPTEKTLRKSLETKRLDELQEILKNLDLKIFEKTDSKNPHRIIRAIEAIKLNNKTKLQEKKEREKNQNFLEKEKIPFEIFYLNWNREELKERIDKRIEKMINEDGLILETDFLRKKFSENLPPFSGIGYKESIDFLENRISKNEMIKKIKTRTHQYAKRQITWFRKSLQKFSKEKINLN